MVLSKTGQTEGLKVYDHWEKFVRQRVCTIDLACRSLLVGRKKFSSLICNKIMKNDLRNTVN